jgi:hypothetical protein
MWASRDSTVPLQGLSGEPITLRLIRRALSADGAQQVSLVRKGWRIVPKHWRKVRECRGSGKARTGFRENVLYVRQLRYLLVRGRIAARWSVPIVVGASPVRRHRPGEALCDALELTRTSRQLENAPRRTEMCRREIDSDGSDGYDFASCRY